MKSFNMRKLIITTMVCIFLSSPSFAIEEITANSEVSLQDCIDFALSHSHYIKIYAEKVKYAKNNVGIAKSSYFPSVSAGGGYDFDYMKNKNASSQSSSYNARVMLNQLIYSFGKVLSSVKMQKLNLIAAQFDYDDMVLDIVNNVKRNYYGVIAAEANLEVQVANVQINQRQYERAKAFFDEGLVSKIDVVNQEVYLSDAKIQLLNAEKLYKLAFVELNESMCFEDAPEYTLKYPENFSATRTYIKNKLDKIGTNKTAPDGTEIVSDASSTSTDTKADLLSNFKFKNFEKSEEECIDIAMKQRPDFQSIKAAEDYAKEYIKLQQRSYLPDLTGSASYNFINADHLNTNSFGFGVNLSTSNLNFVERNLEIKQAKIQYEIAQQTTHEMEETVLFDVKKAYIALTELEQKIPLMQDKVMQTLENYELADARYEVGLGSFIELQDAKVNYNNAQQSYIQTVYTYNTALVDLQSAMGER